MNRADRWLERLNFSTRARHAMVQAELDWRHELQASSTMSQALRVHALGACGVARVLAHEAISSLAEAVRPGWISRIIAACAVVTVVLSVPRVPFATLPRLFSIAPGFHAEDVRFTSELLTTLVASALSSVWIGLFIGIVARKSGPPVPLAGLAIVGVAIMTLLANVGWPWALRAMLAASGSPIANPIRGAYRPLQYGMNASCIAVFALLASAIARTSRPRYLWSIYPFALMFGLSAVVISLVPALGLTRIIHQEVSVRRNTNASV